ncbi:MAG: YhcH/YjgK/YiaL family protein [Prevotella sp.]|nr:YhcH/YjgK/YiaL family protein [Prevotella sp.]
MVFDKIDKIELYKGLSDDIYEGLKFLKQADSNLAVGTYQVCPGVKAIVSEYETKTNNEYGFEAHKQYIDIQGLLFGEERVACLPIEKLKETKPYSEEMDAAFYSADEQPQEMIIGNGYFAIFYPQDGHMPQLCIDSPKKVKKVVVKVKNHGI